MALVAWNDGYSVKVRQFDEQHKKIMDIVNKLHDAMRDNKGPKIRADVLTTLAAYTQAHFSDEERLMRHHYFPGFRARTRRRTTSWWPRSGSSSGRPRRTETRSRRE